MSRLGLALALLTTAGFAEACGPTYEACPAIGQAPVVSLTIPADYVSQVKGVHLKACQDGNCKQSDLELMPGMTSVDQGCEPGPNGSCSATSSPDGTLRGMLMMDVLSESPINATAKTTAPDGSARPEHSLTFTPKDEYPFGRQCGKFLNASLILDASGLRQE